MSEIQNRYPEINLEIIDEEKLNRDEILSIDKKLNIDIHRYALDYKTGNLYFNQIVESFDKDELLNDWINNKKSWGKKAKEINVPIKIFSSVIKSLFPVKGTEAYYQFLIDRYINEEALRNKLQKGASVKSLAKCLNGLHARKNRAMLNRINSTIKVIHGYK